MASPAPVNEPQPRNSSNNGPASTGAEQQRSRLRPRGCTDLAWLFLLAAFLAAAVFVASFALVLGDPRRLVNGCDSFGNVCGARNTPMGSLAFSGLDASEKPYLFYLDLTDPPRSLKICVKHCPFRTLRTMEEVRRFTEETGSSLCRYDVGEGDRSASLSNQTVLDFFNKEQQTTGLGPCPTLPVPPSKPVLNRCVPDGVTADVFQSVYGHLNSVDTLQQVVSDLFAAWREVAAMLLLACVLAFLVILLIHRLAELAAKLILVASVLSVTAVAAVLWWTYADIKLSLDSTPFELLLEEAAKNERAFLVFACGATILAAFLALVAGAMRQKVALAGALFREAGQCVRHMPFLLAQPVWTLLALAALFTAWTVVLLHLATADHASRELRPIAAFVGGPVDGSNLSREVRHFTLVAYDRPSWVRFAWCFQLLFLLWAAEFVLSCQQTVVAGAVASWYFCKDRAALRWPVGRSAARLCLYHLGSVALGSLLIPVCRLPRFVLSSLRHWTHRQRGSACCDCVRRCGSRGGCFWCYDHTLRYVSADAYTVVAIRGVSFCTAGRTALHTVAESAAALDDRAAAVLHASPGCLLLLLAQCLVSSVAGLVAVVLLRQNPELQLYAVPLLAVGVFSCFVAHCVLSLYAMVLDTLLLCFAEDLASRPSDQRDLYAPEGLRRLLLGDAAASLRPLAARS